MTGRSWASWESQGHGVSESTQASFLGILALGVCTTQHENRM